MFANENSWDDAIQTAAARYGVPIGIVKATIGKESSFNPRAFAPEPGIGDASRGLMQLLARTARGLGYSGPIGDDAAKAGGLYDPALSINLGTKLLRELRGRYPSAGWDEIYSAYQRGKLEHDPTTGALPNENKVAPWRTLADYFAPGWRTVRPT